MNLSKLRLNLNTARAQPELPVTSQLNRCLEKRPPQANIGEKPEIKFVHNVDFLWEFFTSLERIRLNLFRVDPAEFNWRWIPLVTSLLKGFVDPKNSPRKDSLLPFY